MRSHRISFQNAFAGIWTAITTQTNIRIHFIVASLVIGLGVLYEVSSTELLVLILTIGLVVVAEMINTSLEFLCDAVTLEHNENIKRTKDVSAGAVLIASIFAALIGLMIFIPKLL